MAQGFSVVEAVGRLRMEAPDPSRRSRIYGLRGGARPYFVSRLLAAGTRPGVVVLPSSAEVEEWAEALRFFLGESEGTPRSERRVHAFPAWDSEPLSGMSPTGELVGERLRTLHELGHGAPIVVTSAEALLQRLPPPEEVRGLSRLFREGEEAGFDTIVELLHRGGYHRAPAVEDRGEYSVRGGIVDFFPAVEPSPLRLELDGDRLERIRRFDPGTQRSGDRVPEALVTPWREAAVERWQRPEARRRIEARALEVEFSRTERLGILARLESGLPFPGSELLLPLVLDDLASFAEHCPRDTLFWIDRPADVEAAEEAFARSLEEQEENAVAAHRLVPHAGELYLRVAAAREARGAFETVEAEALEVLEPAEGRENELHLASFRTTGLGVTAGSSSGRNASMRPLVERLEAWGREGDRLLLVVHDRKQAVRLQGLLASHGIDMAISSEGFSAVAARSGSAIVLGSLSAGFRLPADRLTLVTEEEIFGERRRRPGRAVDVKRLLTSLSQLQPGDSVVHIDHGIARYQGLRHLQVAGTEGDYLHLEYHGGDRLYLPVDRINVIEKYVGADGSAPDLDRLGGASWEKVKAKARESVLAMAHELLEISAAREISAGHAYGAPDDSFREFEARFAFEETPDQQRAIDDVLADLARKKPMDRLVCGDVGFGKTEVALRGAFNVVMEGKQVVVLVPTTVLAQQHFQTFRTRFEGFPVRIEMLSRFRRGAETARILAELENGTVDVLIGTQRLLQGDVRLKDLGLLVIDEEHRFGVGDKERIKRLKKTVDVLTLTATPIPRTLHMALSGIRDLSLIESPPLDRQVIRTYVTRFDDKLVRDAILRELARGGQVFFVHNRVETIARFARRLEELVPEARFAVAHGQMNGRSLERVMLDFLEKRTDVLVTTAIIESGLDIPNANTIFVDRADQFGLAQLYQLRGRVGRSSQRAYAYLLIPGETLLGRDAQKRLEALASLDDLGGGFRLAMHDLEIRGAGNLLGREQSGHVAAVGFDLYTRMLDEAIRELRGETLTVDVEPEIQIGIAAFIPEDYVPDVSQRLVLYKRLARAATAEELDELRDEMGDRFGPPPMRVVTFFQMMDLRRRLKEALVVRLRRHGGRLAIRFHDKSPIDPERLMVLVADVRHRGWRVTPDREITFPTSRIDLEGVAAEVLSVLRAVGAIEDRNAEGENGPWEVHA